ncbi:hypothetical protein [Microbispora sp. NBRC 16548]|uniref:hypothetical protein n=1 Tax=Microbispora sp. NBRC 16548 TaxID=3030994 RepID=UPI00161675DA|nr:hypothetical protein [Microbispora sp. NBRC 16548]GLX06670.1 hypothetical protein Misp03_35970 [Microbispora sp. NBRC 16548]
MTAVPTDEELAAWVQQAWAVGEAARAEHLRRCTVRLARLVRQHFPEAAAVTVDVTDCMPRGDAQPNLLRIHEPAGVVWDWDDPDTEWRLTLPETQEIEGLLVDALAFDVTHQVLAEAGWQQAEHDHDEYTITLLAVEVPAVRVPVVWLPHQADTSTDGGTDPRGGGGRPGGCRLPLNRHCSPPGGPGFRRKPGPHYGHRA